MSRLRVGVLASGRGTNLQSILDASEAGEITADVVAVASDNGDAPALERAERHGVPHRFVDPAGLPREDHEDQVAAFLETHDVELVCLAGYMRLLTSGFLQRFPQRVVNIHPSLLPAFKGLAAQEQAWEYGVRIAGCTTHIVTEEMDHGPVLLQAAVPVLQDDDADTLAARILEKEHEIYPATVQLFAEDRVRVEGRRAIIEGGEAEAGRDVDDAATPSLVWPPTPGGPQHGSR